MDRRANNGQTPEDAHTTCISSACEPDNSGEQKIYLYFSGVKAFVSKIDLAIK